VFGRGKYYHVDIVMIHKLIIDFFIVKTNQYGQLTKTMLNYPEKYEEYICNFDPPKMYNGQLNEKIKNIV